MKVREAHTENKYQVEREKIQLVIQLYQNCKIIFCLLLLTKSGFNVNWDSLFCRLCQFSKSLQIFVLEFGMSMKGYPLVF